MTLPVEVQCAGIVRPNRETTRTAAGPSTAATKADVGSVEHPDVNRFPQLVADRLRMIGVADP